MGASEAWPGAGTWGRSQAGQGPGFEPAFWLLLCLVAQLCLILF